MSIKLINVYQKKEKKIIIEKYMIPLLRTVIELLKNSEAAVHDNDD